MIIRFDFPNFFWLSFILMIIYFGIIIRVLEGGF